jgi:hypothetical protein
MAIPEWVKVVAGSIALMIGASVPSLIIETIEPYPRVISPTPSIEAHAEGNTRPNDQYRDRSDNETGRPQSFWQRANDPVAIGTFLVAFVTGGLAIATYRAARDTRRALFLMQRPRIRVRNIVVHPSRGPGYSAEPFHPLHLVSGQLYCANVGGTEARLFEAHCEVYWTTPGIVALPMERPYEGKNPNIPKLSIELQPGASYPLPLTSDRLLGGPESDQISSGALMIYILGFVAYADRLGIKRRTAFCRRYDHHRGRFFAVEDPDYEHEE